jgi:hypothetical protein
MNTFHDPAADQSAVIGSGRLFSALNQEWSQIRHLASSHRTVARWARRYPVLAGATDPHDIITMIDTADSATKDDLFTALILLAQDGQDLASRTLLQAMLPKLSQLARGSKSLAPIEDRRQLIVGAFWEAVKTIRVENRNGHFAGQLALDAHNLVYNSSRGKEISLPPEELPRKSRWASVQYCTDSEAVHDEAQLYPDKDSNLSEVLNWMLTNKQLSDSEVSLMESVYIRPQRGHTQAKTAADLQMSFPAMRKRCSRITTKIKAAMVELHPELTEVATPTRETALTPA